MAERTISTLMGHGAHLIKRFLASLSPAEPPSADVRWAREHLLEEEAELWHRMSRADRRHSLGVARRSQLALGPEASRPMLAAALLHDVGKVASGLGTGRRVMATVVVKAVGRGRAVGWSEANGARRLIGLYANHPQLGAQLLERAGSDPLTIAWTREHHLPEQQWTVPQRVGGALSAADDD